MKPRTRLWARRAAWLFGLWGASVAVLFIVAQVLKAVMRHSGLA